MISHYCRKRRQNFTSLVFFKSTINYFLSIFHSCQRLNRWTGVDLIVHFFKRMNERYLVGLPSHVHRGPTNRSRPKSDFIFQFGRKLSKYQTEYQNSCILKQRFINKWNYRSVLHKRGDESSLEKGVKDIPKCQVRKPCHLFLGISPHTYAASFSSATTTTTLPPSYSSESSPTHSPSSS